MAGFRNAQAPTGAAGGDLAGTYPSPTLATPITHSAQFTGIDNKFGTGAAGAAGAYARLGDEGDAGNIYMIAAGTGANIGVQSQSKGTGENDLLSGAFTGVRVGNDTTQPTVAFNNTAPIAKRAGAAQNAVAATGSTNVTPFGYTTAGQADAIVTLVNELRAALVALGLIKGSA